MTEEQFSIDNSSDLARAYRAMRLFGVFDDITTAVGTGN